MTDRAFCPECGATLDVDAEFCTACGADVQGPRVFGERPASPVEEEPASHGTLVTGSYLLGVVSVLLLLWPAGIVGFVLAWYAHRKGNPKARQAMIVTGALTVTSLVLASALAYWCLTGGSGTEVCRPFQEIA